jgi:hypothetical protein
MPMAADHVFDLVAHPSGDDSLVDAYSSKIQAKRMAESSVFLDDCTLDKRLLPGGTVVGVQPAATRRG